MRRQVVGWARWWVVPARVLGSLVVVGLAMPALVLPRMALADVVLAGEPDRLAAVAAVQDGQGPGEDGGVDDLDGDESSSGWSWGPLLLAAALVGGAVAVWRRSRPDPARPTPGRSLERGPAGELETPSRAPARSGSTLSGFTGTDPATGENDQARAMLAVRAAWSRSVPAPLDRVEVGPGAVDLVLKSPARVPPGFRSLDPRRWRTTEPASRLSALSRCAVAPTPALVSVGSVDPGSGVPGSTEPGDMQVFLDVEATRVVIVEGSPSDVAWQLRAMALAVGRIPSPEQPDVVLVGLTGALSQLDWVSSADTLAAALTRAESHARRTLAAFEATGADTLAEARSRGELGDSGTPLVVVSALRPETTLDRQRLRDLAVTPNNGVAVVTRPPSAGVLPGRRLRLDREGWLRIDGVDAPVRPPGLEEGVIELVDVDPDAAADLAPGPVVPAPGDGRQEPATSPGSGAAPPNNGTRSPMEGIPPPEVSSGDVPGSTEPFDLLAEVSVLVRVLGPVEAVRLRRGLDGDRVEEPLELDHPNALGTLVYLALREGAVERTVVGRRMFPEGADPGGVEAAVEAARAVLGEELIWVTPDDRYELAETVATDYSLFCELVAWSEEAEEPGPAVELLTAALDLVTGEPFSGVNFPWAASYRGPIVADVVDAVEELAEIQLVLGELRAAERTVRQGLQAAPEAKRLAQLLPRVAGEAAVSRRPSS